MISVLFQGKPFNITVIPVYAPTTNAKEAEDEWFYGPTRPSRINTQKRCPFNYRVLECKSRKSRVSGERGKFGLGVKNEARHFCLRMQNGHSKEFYQQNALVIAKPSSNNTRDDSTHDISRWSIPKPD